MSCDLSAVIPIYNEVENLEPLHAELTAALVALRRSYEIIYVDDGSSDASFVRLTAIQARDPHTVVVRFPRNFGQTAALAAGFDHARGAVIVALDGDRQNDPADIAALLQKLD